MSKQSYQLPEIWGGIECTINRVHDRFLDQSELAGLYDNPGFIDLMISLGIKRLRFPVLWEKLQPSLSKNIDWSFTEKCLIKLRENDIIPIAGLLHHGSGPAFTDLLQDNFPALFSAYAAKVAARFPWLTYYTPVNEPLTTARFSGLYGHWYPHKKNDVSFIKMLLNELKASVLAMQEIRKINPAAKFIQTEDLGKTYSSPLLSYQAAFENHRRWLTYDILCGKFDNRHPLWEHVMRLGIEPEKLQFFIDNPCVPDMIGVNHYLTSERYLDHNIDQYPLTSIGGNGLHQYADIEAIRMHLEEPHGLEYLLKEAWQRYKIPLVITEVHLNCTREEQLRWLHEVYEISRKLKKEGVDIRAVTVWALLGSFGWNKLLTCQPCEYESGAFDISAGYIRPTALAFLTRSLSRQENFDKHLTGQAGWWKRNTRYYKRTRQTDSIQNTVSVQPVIIIGKTGTLGQAFSHVCNERHIHHFLLERSEADLCKEEQLASMINRYHPWAVINASGYANVDEAEANGDLCYKENYFGVAKLAVLCKKNNIKLLTFSSDLVFDGCKQEPYIETDVPKALNTYGRSKELAEKEVLHIDPHAMIVRTAAFFGPWDKYNFVYLLLKQLEQGNKFVAASDVVVSPTYIPHLVHTCLDLLIDDACGIWHLVNKGCLTWYEFAKEIVKHTGLDSRLITQGHNLPYLAKRPLFSALSSIKYGLMPSLEEAIRDYFLSVDLINETITQNMTNERI